MQKKTKESRLLSLPPVCLFVRPACLLAFVLSAGRDRCLVPSWLICRMLNVPEHGGYMCVWGECMCVMGSVDGSEEG